jgi:hypothetical protein
MSDPSADHLCEDAAIVKATVPGEQSRRLRIFTAANRQREARTWPQVSAPER